MTTPFLLPLADILADCHDDPGLFNEAILGRPPYWHRQEEILRSVVDFPVTLVPTGNMVGKTWAAAGAIFWFLLTRARCMVLATAPSQTQLEEVLWKNVLRAYEGSRFPIGGRTLKKPLKVDLGSGWHVLAYSTTSTERLSGHHEGEILAILDEASGIEPHVWEAITSCNPSRWLIMGNPLRPDGPFYDRCLAAQARQSDPGRVANLIRVSSLESPHIDLPRSPWGLADAGWLALARNDYGEGSLWWTSHVLGEFPDTAWDAVIARSWLDRAAQQAHRRGGNRRVAIDLAEGKGLDRSVVLTRDDNGICEWKASSRWGFDATAREAARQAKAWAVEPARISFDVGGCGADFANRLEAEGVKGSQPYRGGGGTYRKFKNLRAAAAWALRQRLDPGFKRTLDSGLMVDQIPFALPPDFVAAARDELQGLRYELDPTGRIELEAKELFSARLRKSPDLADALMQSFAFPD